ncbi:MAG: META domain-containing protein [Parvularculaceae bacterium]
MRSFLISGLAAALSFAGLSACKHDETGAAAANIAAPAQTAPAEYSAGGNEPGWSLKISADRMSLDYAYGEKKATTPLPAMTEEDGVRRYHAITEANDLDVAIAQGPCADSATGKPYPDKVTIMINGETLEGCGGDPKSLLVGGKWIVEDLENKGVMDDVQSFIAFSVQGATAGNGGCNRFRGRYEITGEGIRFSKVVSTERACVLAVMDQETRFFDILAEVTQFEIAEDGALVLTASDGRRILARREQ